MGALDDLMKLTGTKPAEPIIENTGEKGYEQVFNEASTASTLQSQKEDKGFLDKVLDT